MTKMKYNKRLSLFIIFTVFFCSLAVGCVSAADNSKDNITDSYNYTGLADSPSPKSSIDTNNSGQSDYTGPQNNTTKWTNNNITLNGTSVVIGTDGTIYAGSTDGYLYALNPDGTLKWSYNIGTEIKSTPAIGNNETIYVFSRGYLYAISSNGTCLWSDPYYTGKSSSYDSPTIGSDGTIYIGTKKYFCAVTPGGKEKWKISVSSIVYDSAAIGTDGIIYITSGSTIYALNPADKGNTIWSYTAENGLRGPTIGTDGTIYAIGDKTMGTGSILYAFNSDLTLKWDYTVTLASDEAFSYIYSVPVVSSDGTIYFGTYTSIISTSGVWAGNIYAIDSNRNKLWTYRVGQIDFGDAPFIGADGTIYIGSVDGTIYALNPNGTLKWNYTTNGSIYSSPVIDSDGTLYIGSTDGTLYAIQDVTADFTTNISSNGSVQFTDNSTNTPITWNWDFGDGTTSEEQNPTHTYNTPGTYTATLTITTAYGDNSTTNQTLDFTPPTITSNLPAGTYNTTQTITLTSDDTTATIYYTTDGTDPRTSTTRIEYTSPLTIDNTTTLRYAAIDTAENWSQLYIQSYVIGTGALANSSSPEFGINNNNTGQSDYTGPQNNTTKWTLTLTEDCEGMATGSDGTLYAILFDGTLCAINPDGTVKWSNETIPTDSSSSYHTYSTPAVGSDGTIYVTIDDTLFAFDSEGNLKWKYIGGSTRMTYGSPGIGADGTIYYVTAGGVLYAINPDGTQKWNYTSGVSTRTTPVIGSDGTIYFGYGFAVYPDGTLKWSNTSLQNLIYGTTGIAIASDGTIIYSGNGNNGSNGVICAVNPDGTIKWSTTLTGTILSPVTPAIASNGTIYIGTYDTGIFYSLDSDGNILWNQTIGGIRSSAVIGADGTIYVQTCSLYSASSNFYALNPDRSIKWQMDINGKVIPVIGSDGTLYLAKSTITDINEIYAIQDVVADFTADQTSGNNSLTVQFTDNSTNIPTFWIWDFGDGTTSDEQNPTHTYNTPGTYTVTLTISTAYGDTSTTTKTNYITITDTKAPTITTNVTTGTYNTTQTITLTSDDTTAIIYYTTDGTEPTSSSTQYTTPLTIDTTTTLKFAAVDTAGNWSPITTETYTIDTVAPTVTADITTGTYNTVQTVSLTSDDDTATIYYTTDGTNPTTTSNKYTNPLTINTTTTLKFVAIDTAGNWSPITTQTYTIDTVAPTVTADITTGTYNTTQTITLTSDDTTAIIYYTTDGTNPTTTSNKYTNPLTIDSTTTLKYTAVDTNGNWSPITTQTYTIDTTAPTVTADITTGTYNTTQTITLTSDDTTAIIYYTTDGTNPTTTSNKYTNPLTIDSTTTLKFVAIDTAGNQSPVESETYTIKSDIYLEVSASNSDPKVGDTVTYTFKVGNNGPGTAQNVIYTYIIPKGLEFVSATVDQGAYTYDATTRTLTWNLGDVEVGDPYLWLDLLITSTGTYTLEPTITVSGYNPNLNENIGTLTINAAAATTTSPTNNNDSNNSTSVNAATTTNTEDSIPMQKTGMPLAGFVSAILLIIGGLTLTRRNMVGK